MADPRAENCRQFAEHGGKVTGVRLAYVPDPASRYELIRASLVDEETAKGQVVASVTVLDREGLPAAAHCYLAWPWEGWQHADRFENALLPGNANVPYQHVITNKYNPADMGPLAIFIGDGDGNVQSDVLGGLGLPAGRHVGYQLIFRERGGEPVRDEESAPAGALAAQLVRIEEKLDRLMGHFGLEP